jgi:high-affinity nickel-transport protein
VARVVLLAFLFTAGMVVTDAVNGFWVSRLAARADHVAVIASRVMSLAVAGASLLVAGLGAARLALPATARWSEGRDLGAGVAVCALMAVGYLCARWLARRECAAAGLRQKSRPA